MSSTSTPAASIHRLFVYGTLLDDEVVKAVLKRVPSSSPATLDHHHRYGIKGRVYPAILPVESKKVTGKVLLGITDLELDILDTYEDVEYERRTVEVTMIDSLEKLSVYAYVWENRNDPNLHGDWNFDEWKQLHFKDYLEMTFGFMEELESERSEYKTSGYP